MDDKKIMHSKWEEIRANDFQKQKMLLNILEQKDTSRHRTNIGVFALATILPLLFVLCVFQLMMGSKPSTNRGSAGENEEPYYYLQNPSKIKSAIATTIECVYWKNNELNILFLQDEIVDEMNDIKELQVGVKGEEEKKTVDFQKEKFCLVNFETKNMANENITLLLDGKEYNLKLLNSRDAEKIIECKKISNEYVNIYVWDIPEKEGVYVYKEITDKYKKYYDICQLFFRIRDENSYLYMEGGDYKVTSNSKVSLHDNLPNKKMCEIEFTGVSLFRRNFDRINNGGLAEDEVFIIDVPKDGETIEGNKECNVCGINFRIGNVTREDERLEVKLTVDSFEKEIVFQTVDEAYTIETSEINMSSTDGSVEFEFRSSMELKEGTIKFSILSLYESFLEVVKLD